MKKIILPLGLLCLIGLVGCSPSSPIIKTTTIPVTITNSVSVPVVTTQVVTKVIDPITGNEYVLQKGSVGVANADLHVNDYRIGANATGMVLVLNGLDTEQDFNVYVTPYNNDEITNSPKNVSDWVTITSPTLKDGFLTVTPMSVVGLNVTLNVPAGNELPNTWAFLVNVSYINQISANNTSRWIVNMSSEK